VGPIYLNVTPSWLLEARRRSVEELLRLKWRGLLGTRALGITKEELVQCVKDNDCLDALLRAICAAAKTSHVKTKKEILKNWLISASTTGDAVVHFNWTRIGRRRGYE